MNFSNDIIASLLENPFASRSEEEKRLILKEGRTTPKLTHIHVCKKGTRAFKSTWYDKFLWLCGSLQKNRLFCWPCTLIGRKRNVWCNEGYNDWKNLSIALDRHSSSKDHIQNEVTFKTLSKESLTVLEQINEQAKRSRKAFNEIVAKNRQIFKVLIDLTCLLAKQELSFRGHDESKDSYNQGNFKEFFFVMMNNNEELKNHWEKMRGFTGLSKTIQNDIIECIAMEIKETICNIIRDSPFFSIQVDETTDKSESTQCSVICRCVDSLGKIKEHFLGFYDVGENRSATGICQKLVEILEPFDFKNKLVAQTYDGASVMSSELNGLQAKIRSLAPQALFTHCLAHRLNLVLQHSCRNVSAINIFFANLQGIPSFFHKSAKRTAVLDRIVNKRIPTHSEVRWNSNSKIVNSIFKERKGLIEVFEELMKTESTNSKTIRQAEAYKNKLCEFDFVFYLLIFNDIFLKTEILYNVLQKKTIDIQMCISNISICERALHDMRNDANFLSYMKKAEIETGKGPRTLRNKINNESSVSCHYKMNYYSVLDNITTQINTRFSNMSALKFLALADSCQFAKFQKIFPSDSLKSLMDTYGNYFNDNVLRNELNIVYAEENRKLFHDKDVESILKNIVENDLCITLQQTFRLFSLIGTIPATTASVERSFSCLNRIKSCSRNTIGQERLSFLSLLSIEKELLTELSSDSSWHEKIIKRYALRKDRKIDLLYK